MKKYYLLFIAFLFLENTTLKAQTDTLGTTFKTVRGFVISSEDQKALQGALVFAKKQQLSTRTNVLGFYSIKMLAETDTLVFSFEGMTSREIVVFPNDSVVDVTMVPLVVQLGEAVITALALPAEKKSVAYSVQQVTAKDLTLTGQKDLMNSLAGKSAGLQIINSSGSPGSSVYIKSRGVTSLLGSNQMLIVVDGIPMDNSFQYSGNPDNTANNNLLASVPLSNRGMDLNPDDIQSVAVLKGPAATALYGISASNGAMIITTKKGISTDKKEVHIVFNNSTTVDMINRLPPMQSQFAQGSGGRYRGPESGSSASWGPNVDTLYWDGSGDYKYDRHGRIVGQSNPLARQKVSPYDNAGQFFRPGYTINNSISLSGGNGLSSYWVSFANLNQKGIVPLSDFIRTNVRISGETQVFKKLNIAGSVSYINSGGTRVQQGSNLSGLMLDLLRTPITFDNSNGAENPKDPAAFMLPDGRQRNYRGGLGYDNPYWTINKNPFTDHVNRLFGYTLLDYKPLSWLDIKYRVGTDFYTDRRKQAFDIYSRAAPEGQIYQEQSFYQHVYSDLIAIAEKRFSQNFKFSFMLGNNIYSQYLQQLYVQGDGLKIPGFYNFSNASSVLTRENVTRRRSYAFFGDAKFDYKSMLYLEITGRNEKTSTLPQNKSFFYPSASLAFVFTEPLHLNSNPYFSFGKLRASFAQVGKDAPPYSLLSYYNIAYTADGWVSGISFPFNGYVGLSQSDVLGNSNLRPEKTRSFEIGTDLQFFKNRVGIDVTYYKSKSIDQILNVPIAASTGYGFEVLNAGIIQNKGWEVILNLNPVKTRLFSWDILVNWSRNRNKVLQLAEGINNLFLGGFEGSSIRAVAGQPYGMIYGGRWLRDQNGHIVIDDFGQNQDPSAPNYNPNLGYPIADNQVGVIGNTNPNWIGGLTNTFTYKSLTLSCVFDVRNGGDIWNGTRGALVFFGIAKETENRNETVVFDGVKGHYDEDGNLVLGGNKNDVTVPLDQSWYQANGGGFGVVTEQFVEKSSYVRLRELSLSYNVPQKWLSRARINSLSISLIGRNVLLFTKYTGIDPETSLTGANNAQGMDYFNMPNIKSYGIKLNITL